MTIKIVYLERSLDDPRESIPDSLLPFDGKNVTISMSTLNNRKLNVFPSHLEPCRCVTTSVLRLLVNTHATPHDVARWIVESRYTVYT